MTTTTVFPDANPETTSVDGRVFRSVTNESWATIRGHADGTGSDDVSDALNAACVGSGTTTWDLIVRSFYLFDTSGVPDGEQIDTATLSIKVRDTGSVNDWAGISNWAVNIYTTTPASNTALANADYDQVGTVAQCDSSISIGTWIAAANTYVDFVFNATGRSNISKTGVSKFGFREATYDAPNTEPSHEASKLVQFHAYYVEQSGTTNDPKLVVVSSEPPPPPGLVIGSECSFVGESVIGAAEVCAGFSLVIGSGAYTLTGAAAGLKSGRVLIATAGAYALAGTAASLVHGLKIAADAGAYALTGSTAGLLATRALAAVGGSYALTGTAAGLVAARKIAAVSGAYALTGSDATLIFTTSGDFVLAADGGVYSLSGTAAGLIAARMIAAGAGVYTLTGADADLIRVAISAEQPSGGWEDYAFLNRGRCRRERDELAERTREDVAAETKRIAELAVVQLAAERNAALAELRAKEAEREAMLRAALERIGAEYQAEYMRLLTLEIALLLAAREEEEAVVLLLLSL